MFAWLSQLLGPLIALFTKAIPSDKIREQRADTRQPVKVKEAEIKGDKLDFEETKKERKWFLIAKFGRGLFGIKWKKHRGEFEQNTDEFDYPLKRKKISLDEKASQKSEGDK